MLDFNGITTATSAHPYYWQIPLLVSTPALALLVSRWATGNSGARAAPARKVTVPSPSIPTRLVSVLSCALRPRTPPAADRVVALQAAAIAKLQTGLEAANHECRELRRRLVAHDERGGRFLERMDALRAAGTLKDEQLALKDHMLEQASCVIDDKDHALRETSIALAKNAGAVVSLERTADSLRAALVAARAEVCEKERLLVVSREALDAACASRTCSEEIIEELQGKVDVLDAEVQALHRGLHATQTSIEDLNIALDAAHHEVSDRNAVLAHKDQVIAEKEGTILQKDSAIASLDLAMLQTQAIAQKHQASVEEKSALLVVQDASISDLKDERDAQNEIIAQLKRRVETLQGTVIAREQELQDLKAAHHDSMEDALARKSDLEATVIQLQAMVASQTAEIELTTHSGSSSIVASASHTGVSSDATEDLADAHAKIETLSRTVDECNEMLEFAAAQMQACKADNVALVDKSERLEVDLELRDAKIRKLNAQLLASGVSLKTPSPKARTLVDGRNLSVQSPSPGSCTPTPRATLASAAGRDGAVASTSSMSAGACASPSPSPALSMLEAPAPLVSSTPLAQRIRPPLASTSSHNVSASPCP